MKYLKLFNSFLNEDLENEEESIVTEKHWDNGTINPKVKVGDTFDNVATSKGYRNKVVYVSKNTGAFVVQKVTEYGVEAKEFYVFYKEGSNKLGGSLDMTTDLSDAKRIADNATGSYGVLARNEAVVTEGVVSIKGGRILAHKVLNKLVDMEIIPVKKKTEDLVEAIASLLATTSMSESIDEGYEVHYSDGIRAMKKFGSESQAISFAKDLIKNKSGIQFVDVFNAGPNFHSTADTSAIVAFWGDGSYTDNVSKKDPKLAAKKIDESELNESELNEGMTYVFHVYPRDEEGNHIPKKRKTVKIKRANIVSAREALYKDYPTRFYFSELNDTINEGMVQVAGKNKPSGAKVLATIIVDDLMKKEYLKPGADKVKSYLVDDVQDVIMNNTF
jgi:hypothetical protein